MKRITIPEIRQHPWFTTHLPRYLAVMQVNQMFYSILSNSENSVRICTVIHKHHDFIENGIVRYQIPGTVL